MKNIGSYGEHYTAEFLQKQNCYVDEMNYTSRYGEIDIIAHNKKYILFVEVKLRKNLSMALPREAVTRQKQIKIIKTAQIYMQNVISALQPRFDVCEIYMSKSGEISINYIKNAFDMEYMDDSF